MLLSDRDLRRYLRSGLISVDPLDDSQVGPASIDLRLGTSFAVLDDVSVIDTLNPPGVQEFIRTTDDPLELEPGEFILGCTMETVTLGAGFAAQITGKSTLGRLGLEVECTAGFIDPGFSGQITLELYNKSGSALVLWPGQPIAQLLVSRLMTDAERPYGSPGVGRYQGQTGATGARRSEVA